MKDKFMKNLILIIVCTMLCSFYSKAQVLFLVDKITFDKIVEHRDPPGMLVDRHVTPPYLSMDCRIINHSTTRIKLILDLVHYKENTFDSLPCVYYNFLWKKKVVQNFDLASFAFPYELSKKNTIALQPDDTLKFTLKNSFLFVRLYNKLFPRANQTDRKITFEQLLQLLPSFQVEYINKYAKEGEIKELKAKILPIDKLTIETEPPVKIEPEIMIGPPDENGNIPSQ